MPDPHQAAHSSHWGRWVVKRAHALGITTQAALAEAVGCSRQHLCRWLERETPPLHMRRGYESALADALHVDRQTLFSGYVNVDPVAAPEPPRPGDELRREIKAAADALDGDALRALFGAAHGLLEPREGAVRVA